MTVRTENKEVAALVDELFGAIQQAQGNAYVSDGETFRTPAQLFERVRGRLEWQREGVRIMRAFLRRYGALHPTREGE